MGGRDMGTGGRPSGVGRLAGLDGLRALAVIAVVLFHLGAPWARGGFLGVDVFFVLSGYLITRLLLEEQRRNGRIAIGRFYIRRARRLLPALGAVLLVTGAGAAFVWRDAAATVRGDALAAAGYATNWWYVLHEQSYFVATGRPSPLQHLWSLAIEEQFYLLWPALLAGALIAVSRIRGSRSHAATAWLVAAVAGAGALASTAAMAVIATTTDVPYGADSSRVYFGTDTHAMGLLAGAALAAVTVARSARTRPARPPVAPWMRDGAGLVALGVIAWSCVAVSEFSPSLYRGGFLAVSAATAVLIAAAVSAGSRLGAWLDVAPMRWLGHRSYAIYLWHWPVAVVTRPGLDVAWPSAAVVAVRVGVALILAELTYRYVEQPVRDGRFGRRLAALRNVYRTGAAWRMSSLRATATASATAAVVAMVMAVAVGLSGAGVTAAAVGPPPVPPASTGTPAAPIAVPTTHPPSPVTTQSSTSPRPAVSPTRTPSVAPTPTLSPSKRAPKQSPKPPTAPTKKAPTTSAPAPPKRPAAVSAFGDSVMTGAVDAMRAAIPGVAVDAAEGRQFRPIAADIRAAKRAGTLAPVVVIHTGNNGIIAASEFDHLLADLAGRTRVVVINDRVPRAWEAPNNAMFAQVVARHGNARLVDWRAASGQHADWLWHDGLHLRAGGATGYAALIAAAIRPTA